MALTTWIYPLDPTGVSRDNLVLAEPQTLDVRRLRVVVLKNGAFFSDSVRIVDAATQQPLRNDGTQWYPSVLYPQPTKQFGMPVYAVIVISDPTVSQNILVDYQVVGAEYSYSQEAALTQIEALNLDDRPITWPNIVGTPDEFNPSAHFQNFDTLYGMEYLVNSVYMLANAILNGNAPAIDQVLAYVDQQNANQNDTTANIQASLTAHLQDTGNPHRTTAAQVGAYTTAQVDAALNALQTTLQNSINTVSGNLAAHVARTDNPHGTTAAEVGAYTTAQTDTAIAAAVDAVRLGFTPVQQSGGFKQGTNKIYIGWGTDGSGLRAQVDSSDQGSFIMSPKYTTDVANLNAAIAARQPAGNYVVQGGNASLSAMSANTVNANGISSNGDINAAGNLGISGTIFCAHDIWAFNSDERFKDRIELIDNPRRRLEGIRGVFHHYSEFGREINKLKDDRRYVGLIAQDVERNLGEATGLAPLDRDEQTGMSRTGENYLTVQYHRLVPLLVETNKQAFRMIDRLTDRLARLERQADSEIVSFVEAPWSPPASLMH